MICRSTRHRPNHNGHKRLVMCDAPVALELQMRYEVDMTKIF